MGLMSPLTTGTDPSGLDLCRPCDWCHSLWVYVCVIPAVFRRPCFLGLFSILRRSLFKTDCSKVSPSLHIVQLWVSVFVPIYCRRGLLCRWLSETLICKYSRMLLGVILSLHSFSRTVVFSSSSLPKSLSCLVSSSWPPEPDWGWVPSHGVGLQSSQMLAGYSHKLCATITLVYFARRTAL